MVIFEFQKISSFSVRTLRLNTVTWAALTCSLLVAPAAWALDKNAAIYHLFDYFTDTEKLVNKQRVINFPADYSLGQILLSKDPVIDYDKCPKGAARGKVVVPAERFSCFVPAQRFFQNPSIANSIAPESIDSLCLTASSWADSEDGLCDRALASVGHFKGLIDLNLDRSDATDKGVAHAADLPNLQKISAFLSMIDGSCFKNFAGLKHLRVINLQGNRILDTNLHYLAGVSQLKFLNLSHTGISDKGVHDLEGCTNLTMLNLSDNPRITDQSIDTLAKLKTLKFLWLGQTSISTAGVMRLKNLSLFLLSMPGSTYPQSTMKQLHALFPIARIELVQKVHPIDADSRVLYAPLH